MGSDKLFSLVSRVFFFGAFALLLIAVIEVIANASSYTILGGSYTGGRLLEFAVILLVFVMAILLRQIRDELRRDAGAK